MRAVARDAKAKLPPLCRYCGKPIRKRTDWIEVLKTAPRTHVPVMAYGKPGTPDQFVQKPTGEMTPIHVPKHVIADPLPQTKEAAQKLVNMKIVSVRRNGEGIRYLSVWDGESYRDEFFCTGEHAQKYAYAMVRSPHNNAVMPAYTEAVLRQLEGTKK
jgi:hypothetical protein